VRTRAAAAAAIATSLAAVGCGTPSPDLFVVHRTGEGRNARLTMLVDDGGEVTCNGTSHALPGPLLLRARRVARDLGEHADLGLRLPRGKGTVLSYRVVVEQGTVSFSDTSPRQPKVFLALQKLTKDISEDVCGLRR
jgi:hypothetical protein